MSEPKFTPGPWTIETPMGDDTPWIVEAGKETYEWHCLAMIPCEGGEDDVSPTEAKANARLIAAAPELYEALANIVPRFEAACRHAGNDDEIIGLATATARAALAKARGAA